MGSTEEYLDSLLKAAMDSEERNATDLGDSDFMSDVMENTTNFPNEGMSGDSDGEMTQEEFAAMLASVDEQFMEVQESEDDMFMTEDDSLFDMGSDEEFDSTKEMTDVVNDVGEREADKDEFLEDMAMEDDDLAEINDLLKKSENDDFSEDDMLAMLEEAASQNNGTDSLTTEEFATEDVFDLLGELEAEDVEDDESNSDALAELLSDGTGKEDTGKKKKEKKNKKDKGEKKGFFKRKKKKKEEMTEEESVNDEFIQEDAFTDGSLDENLNGNETEDLSDLLGQFGNGDMEGLSEMIDLDSQFADGDTDFFIGEDAEFIQADIPDEDGSDAKPKSFVGKFWDWLNEEDEEEIEEAPKKEKKQKKGKKNKQTANSGKSENEEIINEMDSEDAQNKKKKKKKNKVKKEKTVKISSEASREEGKKLPIKMVIRIFVLCFSVMALIILINNVLYSFNSLKQARKAYYDKNYQVAYENLLGKELNESDALILEKTTLILQLQRKYDSYTNYFNMGMQDKALNALLNGYKMYKESYDKAVSYNVTDDYELAAKLIKDALQNTYGISVEKAEELILLDNTVEYQNAIEQEIKNLEVTP